MGIETDRAIQGQRHLVAGPGDQADELVAEVPAHRPQTRHLLEVGAADPDPQQPQDDGAAAETLEPGATQNRASAGQLDTAEAVGKRR